MQDPLGVLLRNSDVRLIDAFLNRNQAPAIDLPVPKKQRSEAVSTYMIDLYERDDGTLSKLQFEAGRIKDLAVPKFDRYFQAKTEPDAASAVADLSQRDRALWFYLNDDDAFDNIEREVSFEHLSGTKTKHTQFETEKSIAPDFGGAAVEDFETEVRKIYRLHDGSGKHATSYPPSDQQLEEGVFLYSIDISQPPSQLAHYGDDGTVHDDTVRKITWLHIRYESQSGALFIVSSRGGFEIRKSVSEQFAKLILGVDTPPAVRKVNEFKLNALVDRELSPLPEQVEMDSKVVEVALSNSRYPGTVMTLRNKEGFPPRFLKRLLGEDYSYCRIFSVRVRIEGLIPQGSTKASVVVASFDVDGSTSFDGNRTEQRRLRDTLPALWNLRS